MFFLKDLKFKTNYRECPSRPSCFFFLFLQKVGHMFFLPSRELTMARTTPAYSPSVTFSWIQSTEEAPR